MERNIRLNWEVIVRQARERRKERGLTQQHLAALANVGRSTLNRFENQSGDITLSSVLRILDVLDMLERKEEGALRIRSSETQSGAFHVTFTPNFGGGARAAKTLASREALEKLLSNFGVSEETQKRAIGEVDSRGSVSIPRLRIGQTELEDSWPKLSE